MNYEVERKLNDKVDKWEFHALQTENGNLKHEISDLRHQIAQIKGENSNRYYAIDRLISLLAENMSMAEIANELHELRSSL
jgi:ribosomal protein L29